jgi:hypothetical protein
MFGMYFLKKSYPKTEKPMLTLFAFGFGFALRALNLPHVIKTILST